MASDPSADELPTCDICGGPKPPEMVDRTTVRTIDPMQADICAACQLVQDHSLPDDACMQCGETLDAGYYLELEFPLGAAGLPGRIAGSLCGDCAGWIACDINYEGLDADDETKTEFVDVVDEETDRLKELEGSA
ncbi:hypothetical protein [Haloarcula onubensis]|uniref:Uncharacterized protein n=1 Tax=Haloarcula onubensis TaxID=2950539 RepID=A0ABU2FWC9_9EURY|nr:hypothetical protein [Halomicroarcula sp. S3CR25-11]MDS0284749.1 hypothetical protein [Halomicroarcula sp. S3CR25-11]